MCVKRTYIDKHM